MKTIILILSILTLTVNGCGQTAKKTVGKINNESQKNIMDEVIVDVSQNADGLPDIGSGFIALFPDMVLGEYPVKMQQIPRDLFERYLPDFIEFPTDSLDECDYWMECERMYAIGKLLDHNGIDLFLCEYQSENVLGSDNHIDSFRYLLFFKNGVPITDRENPRMRFTHTMDYHYNGEGGETIFKSYFDRDSTIVSSLQISERESATGYSQDITSLREYRWRLDDDNDQEVLEITRLEFSSPFYDRRYLADTDWSWAEENNSRAYPTEDDKWNLYLNSLHHRDFDITIPRIELYVHIDKIEDELVPVFETYDVDGKPVGRYAVGMLRNEKPMEKTYSERSRFLKCPIIIKTSDGDLELLSNGKFVFPDR